MSLLARLLVTALDAGQTALEHSGVIHQQPPSGGRGKAAGCTPCAVAANRDRAAQQVAAITGRAPIKPVPNLAAKAARSRAGSRG